MDYILITQLITSFIIGGGFIALITFIAERSSEKTAGIILMLPSTIAINLFFLGWAISAEKVAEIAPAVPALMGLVMIYATVYLYVSKFKISKITSITISTITATVIWLIMAIPMAIYEFSNLWLSILIYIFLTGISYYLITIKPQTTPPQAPLKYSKKAKIFRAIFAGCVISFAVFLSKSLGPFWGGIFAMFPAVFSTSLIIIHWHYNSEYLFKVWKNTPIGSILIVFYGIAVIYSFPAFGFFIGTIAAYLISLIPFFILLEIKKKA